LLYKYMSNKQQQNAPKMKEQSTTPAINNLLNKTSKFGFIKLAMDTRPADTKYDVDALLEKTRSEVNMITKNRVGESASKTIANELTVRHIVETFRKDSEKPSMISFIRPPRFCNSGFGSAPTPMKHDHDGDRSPTVVILRHMNNVATLSIADLQGEQMFAWSERHPFGSRLYGFGTAGDKYC
ncbi:MAG: hypothetical protein ACKPCM_04425, partial [Pseudanabaena sp.]